MELKNEVLGFHGPWCLWKWKSLSRVQLFVTPGTIESMEFSNPEHWVGSLSLLQGIFPTQGSNPGLPHYRQFLYHLSHQGSTLLAVNSLLCPHNNQFESFSLLKFSSRLYLTSQSLNHTKWNLLILFFPVLFVSYSTSLLQMYFSFLTFPNLSLYPFF